MERSFEAIEGQLTKLGLLWVIVGYNSKIPTLDKIEAEATKQPQDEKLRFFEGCLTSLEVGGLTSSLWRKQVQDFHFT